MMQTSICADLLLKTIVETQQNKRYSLKDAFAAHGIGIQKIIHHSWGPTQNATDSTWNDLLVFVMTECYPLTRERTSLRKGQERYQWRLAEVRCLLVENYSNSRQVWSSRSFLQFLGGLRPNECDIDIFITWLIGKLLFYFLTNYRLGVGSSMLVDCTYTGSFL